jgi:ABC-type lipoprotein export system ATPase subunit
MRAATTESGSRPEKRLSDSPLIECDRVSRRFGPYGDVAAVGAVSCVIHRRTRVALTGPSGSGKSTLLYLLAGLDRPTFGTVRWPGLGGAPHARPGTIGMVFQGPSLIPALSVTENVALPLLLKGVAEQDAVERSCLALDRLAIGGLGPKLPEQLSGGQVQRVAVARVLASRPRLILADEPTGQLDHATAALVVSVLLAAADELDAALVVSTHDPVVAARLPTRWTMYDGVLDADTP